VLAVDKMIRDLQAAVAEIGQQKNTYFVFSSDNGYHMGEYRLMPGKQTAYDTDIHVPLVVTGPKVAGGRKAEEIVENLDLAPTFIQIAGGEQFPNVDGASLVPLLHGERVQGWRTVALVEHHGPVRDVRDPDLPAPRSGNPITYEAIRSRTALYVEYANGEREYHDLTSDPDELHNTFDSLASDRKAALHKMLSDAANCHGAKECWAAQGGTTTVGRQTSSAKRF
jgi:N-acetylglucosamine-6-sulfatase